MAEHILYSDEDADRSPAICDGNGSVVLAQCKVCGLAEIELDQHPSCPGSRPAASEWREALGRRKVCDLAEIELDHHLECPGSLEATRALRDPLRPDSNPKSLQGMRKPPLHLVPSSALVRIAMVMKLGAEKYGPYNWRDESVAATVYVSAAERHLRAWLDGQSDDPESGQPHLAHVAACVMILMDASDIGKMIDDRPPAGATAQILSEIFSATAFDFDGAFPRDSVGKLGEDQ